MCLASWTAFQDKTFPAMVHSGEQFPFTRHPYCMQLSSSTLGKFFPEKGWYLNILIVLMSTFSFLISCCCLNKDSIGPVNINIVKKNASLILAGCFVIPPQMLQPVLVGAAVPLLCFGGLAVLCMCVWWGWVWNLEANEVKSDPSSFAWAVCSVCLCAKLHINIGIPERFPSGLLIDLLTTDDCRADLIDVCMCMDFVAHPSVLTLSHYC